MAICIAVQTDLSPWQTSQPGQWKSHLFPSDKDGHRARFWCDFTLQRCLSCDFRSRKSLLAVLWSSGNCWLFSWENSLMSFSRSRHWPCRCYFFSYSICVWRKAKDPLTVVSCPVLVTRIAQWLNQLRPWMAAVQDGAAELSLKRAGALACSTATAALN